MPKNSQPQRPVAAARWPAQQVRWPAQAIPHIGKRGVLIHIPPGKPRPRPLLLLWDGQNVFDDAPSYAGGWHVDRAVARLPRTVAPVVVAVEHGGRGRLDELAPWRAAVPGKKPAAKQLLRGGKFPELLEWVIASLLPAVREWVEQQTGVPLLTGPEHTAVGGSSLGGLASLYAHLSRPDVFGTCLALSPSAWFAERQLERWLDEQPLPVHSRIWLDVGGKESLGMRQAAASLGVALAQRGWRPGGTPRLLRWSEWPSHDHSERAWRRRIGPALRFAFVG